MIREDPFFSNTYGTVTKIDPEPGHTASLSKFMIEKNGSFLIFESWVLDVTYSLLDSQERKSSNILKY